MVPELFMNAKHYFVLTLVSLSPDHSVELFQLFIKIINVHGTIILVFVHKKNAGVPFSMSMFFITASRCCPLYVFVAIAMFNL